MAACPCHPSSGSAGAQDGCTGLASGTNCHYCGSLARLACRTKILAAELKEWGRDSYWTLTWIPSPQPNQLYAVLPEFLMVLETLESAGSSRWGEGSTSLHRSVGSHHSCCLQKGLPVWPLCGCHVPLYNLSPTLCKLYTHAHMPLF